MNMKLSKKKAGAWRLFLSATLLLTALPALPASAATIDAAAYGADGSDALDDTAAIQSAIDAAAAGDAVVLPEGTYYVSSSIRGKTGVTITGADREGTIVNYVGGTDAFVFYSTNVSNAEISNLTIDASGSPIALSAVAFDYGNGNVIRDLNVRNFAASEGFGPHALLLNGSTNAVVSGNVITNIGPNSIWGAGVRAGWGSHGARIENNVIRDTGRGGIFANDGCFNTVVRGNTVSGSGLKEHGLSIELHTNCDNSLIEDNVVDHWISAVRSAYVAVRDNVVRPTDGRVKGIGLEIMVDHGITTGNVVDGGQQVGIQQSPGTGYQYWGYNTVQNLVMWGMQLQGEPNGIERHQYFYKNVFEGTRNDHPDAAYKGYDGNGVRIHGHSQNLTFDSNVIRNNGRKGIEITGAPGVDRISFVNNTIAGNVAESMDPYPAAAEHLEWTNNVVSGNAVDTQPTSRGFPTPKPVADFDAPKHVRVGEPVTFANESTGALPIVENLWDFGEGLPNTSVSPTYVYEKEGTYRVTLVVWDAEGRASLKEHVIDVKKAKNDKKPPNAPTTVAAAEITDETIELVWAPATDKIGVVGYDVYRDGVLIGSTGPGVTSHTATGLSPLTTYSFTVVAKDAAGLRSEPSAPYAVTTDAPDSVPPTAPTNVTIVSQTGTTVQLSWSPSTDNKAVVGYEVFRGATSAGSTGANATGLTVTGLVPGATYVFAVVAKDAAGNVSPPSAAVSATMDPPGATTYLSDLAWTSATVGWGSVERDRTTDHKTITLNGVEYAKGLGTHAHSEIVYHLQGVYDRFQADVGVDDETYGNGAVTFEVWLDGVKAFDSGVMSATTETVSIDLDIAGVDELKLVVTNGGNGGDWDHADWADAKILYVATE